MGRYKFAIQDYKSIKEAVLEPEGFTLIYGNNSAGKTNCFRSFFTVLDNRVVEGDTRHGESGFSLGVTIGEQTLLFRREGDQSSVQFNDEEPRTKIGKAGPMYQLEPRFLLKRYDTQSGDRFYPNFATQNSVPLWDDVDPVEFFGALYSQVSRLSAKVAELKKSSMGFAKSRDEAEAASKAVQGLLLKTAEDLEKLREEACSEAEWRSLQELSARWREAQSVLLEYGRLSQRLSDAEKRQWAFSYESWAPFVEAYLVKEAIGPQVDMMNSMAAEAIQLNASFQSLPDIDSAILSGVRDLRVFNESLGSLDASIAALPDADPELLSLGNRVIELNLRIKSLDASIASLDGVDFAFVSDVSRVSLQAAGLGEEVLSLEDSLSSADRELSDVLSCIQGMGCPVLASGLCPAKGVTNG